MKKIYTLFLILVPFLSQSQTITQADLPTAGVGWTTGNDSTYSAPILAGGTGQTWNYGTLVNAYTDTSGFQDPAGTPYASEFPSSNLFSYDQSNGSYVYFTSNSTGLYADGFVSMTDTLHYNPSLLYIPVPFSYGSTTNRFARIEIYTVFVDSLGTPHNVRIVNRIDSQFEGDGTGTLTIPTGTYPNVLRVKITNVVTDSVSVEILPGFYSPLFNSTSQNTAYRYLTSGLQVNYLLGIEADSLGTTATSSEYYIGSANLSVSKIQSKKKVVTYPNPAINAINFDLLDDNYSVVVFDNNGSEVIHTNVLSNKSLNTEMLKPGLYHFQIINKRNDHIDNGSFVIQH